MTNVLTENLHALAASLAALNGRVRQAVAGEVGRAVAEAVGKVVVTGLSGPAGRLPGDPYRPAGYEDDGWDEDDRSGWYGPYPRRPVRVDGTGRVSVDPMGPAALGIAVAAGHWWLMRQGGPWAAAGVGLIVAAALVTGGPVARSVVAAIWAVLRLLAASDAMDEGAHALGGL